MNVTMTMMPRATRIVNASATVNPTVNVAATYRRMPVNVTAKTMSSATMNVNASATVNPTVNVAATVPANATVNVTPKTMPRDGDGRRRLIASATANQTVNVAATVPANATVNVTTKTMPRATVIVNASATANQTVNAPTNATPTPPTNSSANSVATGDVAMNLAWTRAHWVGGWMLLHRRNFAFFFGDQLVDLRDVAVGQGLQCAAGVFFFVLTDFFALL